MRIFLLSFITIITPIICWAQSEEIDFHHDVNDHAPAYEYQDQDSQKSILDILFGKARDSDANTGIEHYVDETLSPGEVEVNIPNTEGDFVNTAHIDLIDKTIGKLYKLDIGVSNRHQFNEIVINVLSCWNPSKVSLLSDSRALIEIQEVKSSNPRRLFYGWIFSDSPNVHLLEHPKYDVSLNFCSNGEKKAKK